ncbi:hypothetical protein Tco_1033829, partial [Tanacetum coccineum]
MKRKIKPSDQQSRFMKLFKQLRLEIGLRDALIEMPKFNKWLSTLLRNKEKLEEIAITTVNAECSAIILNKVPEKLEDPGKFLILNLGWSFEEAPDDYSSLANHYVRVMVSFLADFVVVNFEPDPRVPIILGRPFLRTAKSSRLSLYEEKLTLRVGSDELVFYADKSEKSKNKQFAHAISVIDFSKDEPFSGSTTIHSDGLPPSSSSVKTSDNLKEFADELTLLDSFLPGVDIDEIDAFLAMEVSSNFEEGYYDSEGDVIFLESLLSDDTPYNLSPEIDIFLVPDDLIPPGVENDDSEDEDNSTFLPENESSILEPSSPHPSPEPLDVCINFKPDTAMKNDFVNEEFNQGTDIANITRKRSKLDKHGHGNGKKNTKARRMLSK